MRYSYEYKRNAVELYRHGQWPDTPDGIKAGNFHHKIREWARIEEACGLDALRHKCSRGRFSCHILVSSRADSYIFATSQKSGFCISEIMMFCRTVICKILPDIFAADKIGLLTAKSLRCADSEWQKHMSLPYIFITNVTGEPSPCHTMQLCNTHNSGDYKLCNVPKLRE